MSSSIFSCSIKWEYRNIYSFVSYVYQTKGTVIAYEHGYTYPPETTGQNGTHYISKFIGESHPTYMKSKETTELILRETKDFPGYRILFISTCDSPDTFILSVFGGSSNDV